MESSIRLVVKTPNQRFKDIHIDCDLGWTVKKLKDYLANVHPTNPESVSQKLIYSGHLLKDEQQLKEVLSKEHDSHTVHIVCPSASEETPQNRKIPSLIGNTNNTSEATMPPSDGLRHRTTSSQAQFPNISSSSYNQWYGSGNQYDAYWQNYYSTMMQQYYQYMNQVQSHSSPSTADHLHHWQLNMMAMYQQNLYGYPPGFTPFHHSPPASPHSEPSSPTMQTEGSGAEVIEPPPETAVEQPQAQVGEADQRQNIEQQNQNMPMNAGGAMFDDDDENGDENRDWLDWFHTFLRATVMLSIMYFYSSTTRILMISLLGFIIYLYQTGWLTLRRAARDQAGAQDRNENVNEQARHQEDEAANQQSGEDSETLNEGRGENLEQQNNLQQPQISPFRAQMSILYTFVTSFFTSLLPQNAQ